MPILPFLASVLLWLSYHPANLNWLVWVSLVPLFLYIYYERRKNRLVLLVWAGGFLFFVLGLFWLRHVSWPGLFIVSFIMGGYFGLFAWLAKFIRNRYDPVVFLWSLPFLWVALEYLRSFIFSGFPWFFLAHTQYRWLSFIQIADLAGTYLISFIILMTNILVALIIIKSGHRPAGHSGLKKRVFKERNVVITGLVTIILLIFAQVYGAVRLKKLDLKPGPKIGIVQGNIEQGLKLYGDADEIYHKQCALTERLIEESGPAQISSGPDLIIWPETMYPYPVGFNVLDLKENLCLVNAAERLTNTAKNFQRPMLVGVLTREVGNKTKHHFNSAYYLKPDGTILNRYDKIHLVPFSEAATLRSISPALERFALNFTELEEFFNLSPGKDIVSMNLGNYRFGVLICYESIFPELVRANAEKGNQFIINISNDGWFKNSAELDQMLAITVFRCVENKISIVRATNTGISAFIEPSGAFTVCQNEQGQFKEIAGAWAKNISLCPATAISGPSRTIYSQWGDYFPLVCAVVFMSLAVLSFLKSVQAVS